MFNEGWFGRLLSSETFIPEKEPYYSHFAIDTSEIDIVKDRGSDTDQRSALGNARTIAFVAAVCHLNTI